MQTKPHTPGFLAEAVKMVLTQGLSPVEAAQPITAHCNGQGLHWQTGAAPAKRSNVSRVMPDAIPGSGGVTVCG